jgi:hypothetical protein
VRALVGDHPLQDRGRGRVAQRADLRLVVGDVAALLALDAPDHRVGPENLQEPALPAERRVRLARIYVLAQGGQPLRPQRRVLLLRVGHAGGAGRGGAGSSRPSASAR